MIMIDGKINIKTQKMDVFKSDHRRTEFVSGASLFKCSRALGLDMVGLISFLMKKYYL